MHRRVHIAATLDIAEAVTLSLALRQTAAEYRLLAADPIVTEAARQRIRDNAATLDRIREAIDGSAVDA